MRQSNNRSKRFLLSAMASAALLLYPAVSAGQQTMNKGVFPEKMGAAYVAALKARAGNGFVCTGDSERGACACEWGKPQDPIYGCRGIDSLCKRMGGTIECDDQFCSCKWVYQ
jgi:hypothetical protein